MTGGGAAPKSVPREALWAWVFSHDSRLIVLSFDRTLIRFVTPRRKPRLAPILTRALKSVSDEAKDGLVIHSGSGLDSFRGLLNGVRAHLIGEHGWEECTDDGRKSVHQLPGRTQRSLESAARAAEACGWRPQLVRRRCSVMLRSAGLPPDQAELLGRLGEHLWSPAFEIDGLRFHSTPDGSELRATERSTEATVDEALRQFWPAATVVHLRLISSAPQNSAGPAQADPERPSLEVRGSGAIDVALAWPRDIIRLLEEWGDRRRAWADSIHPQGDESRRAVQRGFGAC